MAKVLYVLKLALIKPSFVENIDAIRSLVIFYSVLYAEQGLTCIFSAEAPNNDLVFLKQLEEMEKIMENLPNGFIFIVNAALQKMRNHTWYLSERLMGLSLFSKTLDISVKELVSCAILKYRSSSYQNIKEQLKPECISFSNRQLKDFVGAETYHLFDLLKINTSFLNTPVSTWHSDQNYQCALKCVENLSVVNDCSERMLGMATFLHDMVQLCKNLKNNYKVTSEL